MLKLSRLADYAVMICCRLAAEQACLYNVTSLAEETGLGQATVSKLTKLLSKADILTSCRGVNGGYALARPPEEISIIQIIEAIEGPVAITQCHTLSGEDCSVERLCGLKPAWEKINLAVRSSLTGVRLSDLISTPTQVSAPRIKLVSGEK